MKLTNIIQRAASQQWKLYDFKREWRGVILITAVLKLFTNVISILSSYLYVSNLFTFIVNNVFISVTLAIVSLALIELLTTYLLSKFFKFVLRYKFIIAAVVALFCFAIFTLSFIMSCNGIALYKSNKVDNTAIINAKFNGLVNEANKEFDGIKNDYSTQIERIKANPTNWSNGRACLLSASQSAKIDEYFSGITQARAALSAKITLLDDSRAVELAANDAHTTSESDKYYNIVAGIMIVQLLTSGALMFFWSRISNEDCKDIIYNEQITEIDTKINSMITNRALDTFNGYLSILQNNFNHTAAAQPIAVNAVNIQNKADFNAFNPIRVNGFGAINNDVKKPLNNDVDLTALNANTPRVSPSENSRVCPQCGKSFEFIQPTKKFCCPACRVAYYNAHNSGKLTLKNSSLKH